MANDLAVNHILLSTLSVNKIKAKTNIPYVYIYISLKEQLPECLDQKTGSGLWFVS